MALPLSLSAIGTASAAEIVQQGIDIEVRRAPTPVDIEGRAMLTYELHVVNFARGEVTVDSVEVLAEGGAAIAALDLRKDLRVIGRSREADHRTIPAGGRAVAYVTVAWNAARQRRLVHRVAFTTSSGSGTEVVRVTGGDTTVGEERLPKLGAPLRGGPWAAVYAPEMDFGHRRYIYAVRGRATVPGRFAIDWMPAKGFVPGSAGSKVSQRGEGADVLAVADATVVVVKQGPPPDPRNIEAETGAMVVLDLGRGRYAFYQHIQVGPMVRPGQRVTRGQVIAKLGATGHVTQPHLHFHVADGIGPLSSEGLPYHLKAGTTFGRYASISAYEAGDAWLPSEARRLNGFPNPNGVVTFD